MSRRSLLVVLVSAALLACSLHAEGPEEGRRYALVIGVQNYDGTALGNLKYCENDASGLRDALQDLGYRVTLLTRAEWKAKDRDDLLPTAEHIRDHLDAILKNRKPADTVLIAFAGHGEQLAKDGKMYFCPAACDLDKPETLVSLDWVYDRLKDNPAAAKALIVDACRNDPLAGRAAGSEKLESVTRPQLPDPPGGAVALFSCSRGQVAFESDALKHGYLFHYVIEGLKGKAASKKGGRITWLGLANYVQDELPDAVREERGPKADQTPEVRGEARALVLATLATADAGGDTAVSPPDETPGDVKASPEEEQAIEAIEKVGGFIVTYGDRPGNSAEALYFGKGAVKDGYIIPVVTQEQRPELFRNIARLKRLHKLRLSNLGCDTAELLELKSLTDLRILILALPTGPMRALAYFQKLEELDLSCSDQGEALKYVGQIGSLRILTLHKYDYKNAVPLTAESLKPLSGMKHLQKIYIGYDGDLLAAAVSGLPELEILQAGDVKEADSFAALQKCPRLRELDVSIGKEASSGLGLLGSFPSLKAVKLYAPQEAIKYIKDPELVTWLGLDCGSQDLDPKPLACIAGLRYLTLYTRESRHPTFSLEPLKILEKLEFLHIDFNQPTDDELATLPRLPNLQTVRLRTTRRFAENPFGGPGHFVDFTPFRRQPALKTLVVEYGGAVSPDGEPFEDSSLPKVKLVYEYAKHWKDPEPAGLFQFGVSWRPPE